MDPTIRSTVHAIIRYEGLAARLSDPDWQPDAGPAVFEPRCGAVMVGARQPALAQAFVELLLGREGQAVLGRFGFQPPPAGVR